MPYFAIPVKETQIVRTLKLWEDLNGEKHFMVIIIKILQTQNVTQLKLGQNSNFDKTKLSYKNQNVTKFKILENSNWEKNYCKKN